MKSEATAIKGRGTGHNPPNRFERIHFQPDEEWAADLRPATDFLIDSSQSILSRNDSPDVGFEVSVNPYRGCEHGCTYCYARPTHEYLGFSAGLDFETRILVKREAPRLLWRELSSPRWKPQPVALSGVTDPYQPVERKLKLTRSCLQVLHDLSNPVIIITKNELVARDIDLLGDMAAKKTALVCVSVTTLDNALQRVMEPRTSSPERRLTAIEKLAAAGIPVRVLVAPVVPGLTDHEMPGILERSAAAGARHAGYVMLRLPFGVKGLFEAWLDARFPAKKARVLSRIREMRGGALNDPSFHDRMRGKGEYAAQIQDLFQVSCRKNGLNLREAELAVDRFRGPSGQQMGLF